jgi:hypothetical protein
MLEHQRTGGLQDLSLFSSFGCGNAGSVKIFDQNARSHKVDPFVPRGRAGMASAGAAK